MLVRDCSFWAAKSRYRHATAAFRPLAQSHNLSITKELASQLLSNNLPHRGYGFLRDVGLADPRVSVAK